eukprot:scaffold6767_cov223-Isochrysis_galbana.AAC.22
MAIQEATPWKKGVEPLSRRASPEVGGGVTPPPPGGLWFVGLAVRALAISCATATCQSVIGCLSVPVHFGKCASWLLLLGIARGCAKAGQVTV